MNYCVVIPNYKQFNELTENEKICLNSIYKNYEDGISFFLCPQKLNCDGFKFKNIIYFDKKYFNSLEGYYILLTSSFFYKKFKKYDYILIHQLDAFTRKNKIDYFMSLGYDYYGAPWRKMIDRDYVIGNGGLSLRKVDKMIEITAKYGPNKTNEDIWFCYNNSNILNTCPLDIALKFSVETFYKNENLELPTCCHKLWLYNNNLWNKMLKNDK